MDEPNADSALGIESTDDGAGSGAAPHPLERQAARQRTLNAGYAAIAWVIGGVCVSCLLDAVAESRSTFLLAATLLLLSGAGAAVSAVVAIHRNARLPIRLSGAWIALVAFFGIMCGFAMMFFGGLSALFSASGGRGRQIRSFGRVLLPPVENGSEWTALPVQLDICGNLDLTTRERMAAQWRENGRTEHASVAAFAELTRDLMALGAPPALLVSAQRDALDEIRHAEICFALAKAFDGKDESPGPFAAAKRNRAFTPPSRALALASLAVNSLIDGAVHEGVSARMLARLAKTCEDRTVAALVKAIAADEGKHSAHGWDVVRWCIAEGGEPVLQALRGASASLATSSRFPQPAAARDGSWERFAIPGDRMQDEEYARTYADVQKRVAALVQKRQPSLAA